MAIRSKRFKKWCESHDIPTSTGYYLLKSGKGPKTILIGGRRHVTDRDNDEWVEQQRDAC